MKRIFLGIGILLFVTMAGSFCEVASAEITVGSTLEWLTDTSPYIGIYIASKVEPDAPGQVYIEAILSTPLRGNLPKSFSFDYPTFDVIKNNIAACVPKEGDKFLIFLRDAGKNDVRWEHIISLTCPAIRGFAYVAIRPDFSILTNGVAIEKVVRDRMAERELTAMSWREYPLMEHRFDIEVPDGTPAFSTLYAGSACYLLVPSDLQNGAENWMEAVKSEHVNIFVENILYEKEGHPNFFIHIRLANPLDKTIGVDLSDPWRVIYPNQWGSSDLDHRTVIDEITINPKTLDATLRQGLVEAHHSKTLNLISSGNTIDYYVNFNASGHQDVEKAKGKYILISIKGQMFFSDGTNAWDENSNYDLALTKPIEWKNIPKDAMVIEH